MFDIVLEIFRIFDKHGLFRDDLCFEPEHFIETVVVPELKNKTTDISVWKKCTEENYPDSDSEIAIIRMLDDETPNHYLFYLYGISCPYGWNVLISSSADVLKIKK